MLGTSASSPHSVMHLFASFRPSEREILRTLSHANQDAFIVAMEDYLRGWANGDWVEEYNIERIAKWIARTCSQSIVDALISHSKERLGATLQRDTSTVHNKTYRAFLEGVSVREHA